MIVDVTEKLLIEAGGWQAMKQARSLRDSGRVSSATYEPPLLQGSVREGKMEFRAGLKILSKSNIENICTCVAAKRHGIICAHSLAIGLHLLKPLPASNAPAPTTAPAKQRPVEVAPVESPFSSDAIGEPMDLHVILPPNLPAAWEKKSVTMVLEGTVRGTRKPIPALDRSKRYQCSDIEEDFLSWALEQADGEWPAMLALDPDRFLAALGILAGHPRVTLGKATPARLRPESLRPGLTVARTEGGGLLLSADRSFLAQGKLFQGAESLWKFDGTSSLQPVCDGLPAPYFRLFSENVSIPPSQVANFAQRELAVLREQFDVSAPADLGQESPVDESDSGEIEIPEFYLILDGSLNHLTAKLQVKRGGAKTTIDESDSVLYRFDESRLEELQAMEQLRASGFSGPDVHGEWVLKTEPKILSFFARWLPRFEAEWKVKLGDRFKHVTKDIERIEPRLDIRSSGQSWFDLSVGLQSTSGERFPGTEIKRLLQTGSAHIRRRNGKLAVFDPSLLDEFEQVLRDCDPTQLQPGTFRMDRLQAGALDAFALDSGVRVAGDSRWRAWAEAQRNLEKIEPIPLGPLEDVLRPYQKLGVYWLNFLAANGFGGILADEMGLGKTVQTLAFLRNSSGLRLIVCPSSLVYNWEREAGRFVPELRVLPVTGSKRSELFKKINDVDLVITSYPLLRRDIEEYRTREFAAVVLDEAQQIKNPDSLNAQAAMALRASTRFALTGTPVENAVRDIWSIMNFLMPGYLGNRGDFKERYEQALNAGGEGAIAAQQRLARRLRPFLLRRTKKLVAKELPDKIEQITYCELTESQRALYEEVSTAVRREVTSLTGEKDKNKARMVMLTALLRLRQTCCDLRLLGLEKPPDEAACSAKLDLLEELLQEALDGGHRVLVFSQFSTMLGLIKKRLESSDIAHCYLDGGTKNRQAEVDRFQAGEAPVFLISLKAGGTGLTLTAADTVVHFDPWWNPAVEAQATDRAHRIGQKKVVTVYKLIARGTVEEKVLKLQEKKKAVIAATVENEQPMMEGLTMSEIESLLD